MKTFLFALVFLPCALFAKPYYSEYAEGNTIIIFHGNVNEEQEALAKVLERKFMDEDTVYGDPRQVKWKYKQELEKIGISIEIIENRDLERSMPFDSSMPPPPMEEDESSELEIPY